MDTYAGDLMSPVSLHRYLYANADPVNNSDPSGRFTLAECAAAVSIATILSVYAYTGDPVRSTMYGLTAGGMVYVGGVAVCALTPAVLGTVINGAKFWSGGNGLASAEATISALKCGGSTLEMTYAGRILTVLVPKGALGDKIWLYASKIYAHCASGVVEAYVCNPRVDAIWYAELDILMRNQRVTKIIVYDLANGISTVIKG
jgi:hypothetical protein